MKYETIYINLDFKESYLQKYKLKGLQSLSEKTVDDFQYEFLARSKDESNIRTKNSKYAGYYILSSKTKLEGFTCGSKSWIGLTVDYMCISEGLKKDKESLKIKLRKIK